MTKKLSPKQLAKIIADLKKGKTPDANPSLIKIIRELIQDLKKIKPDSQFYAELTKKINKRIIELQSREKTFNWQNFWQWKFALPVILILIVSGHFVYQTNFNPKKNLTISEINNQDSSITYKDSTILDQVKINSNLQKEGRIIGKNRDKKREMTTNDELFEAEIDSINSSPHAKKDFIGVPSQPIQNREQYAKIQENNIKRVSEEPVSTFSIDVDTASYANVRRFLKNGELPRKDAVRVEEMINYFTYDYPMSRDKDKPFSVTTEIGPTPWNFNTKLLHIGLKGYEKLNQELPPSNLVFLLDVSGSMNSSDKLPLLKKSLLMQAKYLTEQDKISLVVYAGASGLVLDGVAGNNRAEIELALENLKAGGSTNGGAGIQLAYATAKKHFIKNGINRVMLATDGDFNVGTTNVEALKELVEQQKKSGIFLTTLGFGTGNYNDELMEEISNLGNGNAAYIDSLLEAQKVLVEERGSTLETIAKDVKIQIEFNPEMVAEYRLIGYENRQLQREDFENDQVDAGEIGAGHTVTALYEIALRGEDGEQLPDLRYDEDSDFTESADFTEEIAFLKIRYKKPAGEKSILLEIPIKVADVIEDLDQTSENFKFSAAVAGFGQKLRGGKYLQDFSFEKIKNLANLGKGMDLNGYRAEFVGLVVLASGF
jgi:Ca-activated chloride channel homolog